MSLVDLGAPPFDVTNPEDYTAEVYVTTEASIPEWLAPLVERLATGLHGTTMVWVSCGEVSSWKVQVYRGDGTRNTISAVIDVHPTISARLGQEPRAEVHVRSYINSTIDVQLRHRKAQLANASSVALRLLYTTEGLAEEGRAVL